MAAGLCEWLPIPDVAALGQSPPKLGQRDLGEHLTRGFTSSFPVTLNMMERPKGVHTVVGGDTEKEVPCHPSPPHTPRRILEASANESRPLQTPPGAPPGPHGDTTYTAEAGRQKERCRNRGRADNIPRDLWRQWDQAGGTRDPIPCSIHRQGLILEQGEPSTPQQHPP